MIFERKVRKVFAKVAKKKFVFFGGFCAAFAPFAFKKSA